MTAPRIHIVTLGVSDLSLSRRFYEALGWKASSASNEHIVFLKGGAGVLALYGRAALAEDALTDDQPAGFAGVTLARNAGSKDEVDRWFATAVAAGARVVKPPQEVFWGGYSSYIADPDGHLWEFAFNPYFVFDEHGNLALPDETP
ncbi:VOC family protein [Dyella jiangningensis]|uniref:VOC family protein n=1 Tax=Dyella jiangningensis TaxID=1379159 RepID=UPI00240FA2FD|nr:VOC family protein [Dyella jiangningensis]MDG2540135.1 VOC family protein [Dyella jiangningensis]